MAIKKTIIQTNLDEIQAYKAINTNEGHGAKECVGSEFTIDGYVIYNGIMTNEETGEVSEMKSIVFTSSLGIIGSNSKTIINSFIDMLENIGDNIGMDKFMALPLKITSGKAKSGNTFYDIELA